MSDAQQTARERILALDAPRTDVVDMPEWGMKVCVATLSLLDSSLASALEAQAMGPADAPRYPAFEWGAPWLAAAARVFLSSEPYRFRDQHLAEVAAASGRPAALIDGEMASWYGSRAIAGLRYLPQLRRALAGAP